MPPEEFLSRIAKNAPEGTTLRQLHDEIRRNFSAAPYLASNLDKLAEAKRRLRIADDPHKAYLGLAGEAESRLVQARRDLTPAQRAALDPIEQMDTMLKQEGILGGLDDLIVRYGDGPAMSQAMPDELPAWAPAERMAQWRTARANAALPVEHRVDAEDVPRPVLIPRVAAEDDVRVAGFGEFAEPLGLRAGNPASAHDPLYYHCQLLRSGLPRH
jgi:hypothetical protein